ncbi:hypothetical protein TCAL_11550 [Tigriopus californicus]|uniref:Probable imidazolonepropionase n=1 Tax=Tigriopus californicus TaxID=6832 RepID=A0A553NWZ9_TIGCA|nr:hypothetical protein TCAL_11550 [Tigriopus californicus]
MKLRIHGAEQIVQVVSNGARFLTGTAMREIAVLHAKPLPAELSPMPKDHLATPQKDGLTVIVNDDGLIHDLGYDSDLKIKYRDCQFAQSLDVTGQTILPGLVDGHTHPVWTGDRVHEFALKLAGATYMEVHAAGGGIHFTVNHCRASSHEELLDSLLPRLQEMVQSGTTTVECKSGYGLDVDTEMKLLQVLQSASERVPLEISATFCGAHAVPKGSTATLASQDVIDVQLPRLISLKKQGQLTTCENIDVFCEKGVFDLDQSRAILVAGQKAGLKINFHGDELNCLNSAEMGAELQAEAISHLEEISPQGIKAMALSGSVAVILPTTAYILRLKSPPVRQMIDQGVVVALGSDFNPNAYCLAMPTVMHLACVNQRLSMDEALVAATINAAHSLGRGNTHGWEHLIYRLGAHSSLISMVLKAGNIAYQKR